MSKILSLLALLDGKKTYAVSLGLLVAGCVACYFDNASLGAVLIGMSGLGASLKSAIKKVEPNL